MNYRLKNGIAFSLILQILAIKWLSNQPEFIEKYYSNGLYPYLSNAMRWLYGSFPFSVGDVIYTLLILAAFRYIYKNRLIIRLKPLSFARNVIMILAIAYFSFHVLWGLNYYRQPIYRTMELNANYTLQELNDFTEVLVQRTNAAHKAIEPIDTVQVDIPYSQSDIYVKIEQGYDQLTAQYPNFQYNHPSIKGSLYSLFLTYMGYGGYLNPFTLESQVNQKIPIFRFPVVSCHEIGHQLGYAAENEANFVGYLAALNNKDHYIKYAALSYALSYCLAEIRNQDETRFRELYSLVHRGVQKDYEELKRFWVSYENPLEPFFKTFYNSFLKANNQSAGIKSYSLVVGLLVAYHQENPL
ncbi:MAG: DUF3810 domain-containing protein [Eudoraea sp.]|nr:DUF3810 domain-containing protein [Eudoraea sp.]